MGGYIALIAGAAKEVRYFRIVAPRKNSRIGTIQWEEVQWPKDLCCLLLLRVLVALFMLPREQLL